MKAQKVVLCVVAVLLLLLAACAQPTGDQPAGESEPENKLDEILARGTIVISTDPAYPPQSELVEDASRPEDTNCASDQHTANEFSGFDIDTAVEIANRLGVEPCFVTPDWTLITGGSWADRWDISVGSMTITPERMEKLYFTQPYYTTPAAFFVHEENTSFSSPEDLDGATIGVCAGCTYEFYLDHSLQIPGEEMNYVVDDADIQGYDTDLSALQDLQLGDGVRLDAVMTALPTGQGAIEDGLPIKQLGEPAFFEYLAAAVDKEHSLDPQPLVERVTEVIQEMHSDGTLQELGQEYYEIDLTSAAADFDVSQLDQFAE